MSDSLEGMTLSVVGRFSPRTNHQISALLEARGARVSHGLLQSTDYLIAGDQSGEHARRARTAGVPIVPEDLAIRLVDGMSRAQFDLTEDHPLSPAGEAEACTSGLRDLRGRDPASALGVLPEVQLDELEVLHDALVVGILAFDEVDVDLAGLAWEELDRASGEDL